MPQNSSPQAIPPSNPIPLHEVIEAERGHIGLEATKNAVGLAFSGDGVRAAASAVGVLQGPSQNEDVQGRYLLETVDYPSSISGGGYTACWLSQQITKRNYKATRDTVRTLADARLTAPRNYGSYPTPQRDSFSGDTWRTVAGYLIRFASGVLFILFALRSGLLLPSLIRDWGNRASDHSPRYTATLCWRPPCALFLSRGFASFAPDPDARIRALGPFALIASFSIGVQLAIMLGDISFGFAWPYLLIAAIPQLLLALFDWIRLKDSGPYKGRLIAAATLIGWMLLSVAVFAINWFWSHELQDVCMAVASIVFFGTYATWTYLIPFDAEDQEFINSLWGRKASIP